MNKQILRLAIPNILSNLSVPLLGSVDTALMGREDSPAYIGAVGLGGIIFSFLYWSFGFLRMGTTGMVAQAYGKNDKSEIIHTLGRGGIVALLGGLFLLVLQFPIEWLALYLVDASTEVEMLASRYFYIRIWAAPATLGLYVLMGWFFGMQNVIYPLILTIFINFVNIIATYILVKTYGMGVDGAALGTVLAQYLGIILAIFLFFYQYSNYYKSLKTSALTQTAALKRFLSVNGDIFLRTFCLTFAFGFFYAQSAALGDVLFAANVVLLQYVLWMAYGIDGFAYAAESLVGRYKGANDASNTNKAIHYAFAWGMIMAVGFSIVYWYFGEALLYLFTDKTEVIQAAIPFLFWMAIFPIISTPCYIWDGVFIGLTASKAMRNSMFIALIGYLVVYYLSTPLGNHAIWLAMLFFMGLRGLIQWWLYQRIK